MAQLLTTKQVARAIGISESSLKRWCDAERIPSLRTAGNHRRLRLTDIVDLVRKGEIELQHPESLGLPTNSGKGIWTLERGRNDIVDLLVASDFDSVNQIVFDLYLGGHPIAKICDETLAPALHDIGRQWESGGVEIYQERMGVNVIARVLHNLQQTLTKPVPSAPLAIGGAVEYDPYTTPTLMAELVLQESGFRAVSLGSNIPLHSLTQAVIDRKPRIMWLSVSEIDDEAGFIERYRNFYARASEHSAIVIGGRAIAPGIRKQIQASSFCDNMQELASFAKAMRPQPPSNPESSSN